MHNILRNISLIKKGRSFLLLPFFIFAISCNSDLTRNGKVTMHTSIGKNSFIFLVNDDFVEKNNSAKPDKKNPRLNQAEAKLLYQILTQKKYCLNDDGKPLFKVSSRQERIYDTTFAHLVEQNYKARPVVPRTFFGECVSDVSNLSNHENVDSK